MDEGAERLDASAARGVLTSGEARHWQLDAPSCLKSAAVPPRLPLWQGVV